MYQQKSDSTHGLKKADLSANTFLSLKNHKKFDFLS